MVYHNLSDYISAKTSYECTRWKCTNEGNFALVNGKWITELEYNQHNTKPRYEPPVIQNPDGTHTSAGIIAGKQR